jgi:hypothetical protein
MGTNIMNDVTDERSNTRKNICPIEKTRPSIKRRSNLKLVLTAIRMQTRPMRMTPAIVKKSCIGYHVLPPMMHIIIGVLLVDLAHDLHLVG